jgi:hypothetical protein
MTEEFTAEKIITTLREWGGVDDSPEAQEWLNNTVSQMNKWLQRGDGIAVYENQELGHPEMGDKKFTSFGSAEAQLETDTPPSQLPDGVGNTINWRYRLIGTYRGKLLQEQHEFKRSDQWISSPCTVCKRGVERHEEWKYYESRNGQWVDTREDK